MRYRFFKYGTIERSMIGMRIKMVPANIGEVYNIGFGNGAFMCNDGIANLQLFKIFSEWMFFFFMCLCACLLYIGNGFNSCMRALQSYPLHIMMHATHTTHFFSTTGTTRAAMNK